MNHKEKVEGAIILGLAVIVIILMKERNPAAKTAPGQTYVVQGGGAGAAYAPLTSVKPRQVKQEASGCPLGCYY